MSETHDAGSAREAHGQHARSHAEVALRNDSGHSPFGNGSAGRTRNVLRLGAYAILVVGAAGITWYVTRGQAQPQAAGGHQHGAMGGGTSGPVHVEPDAARRIGLTFTTVAAGSIVSEIRTVGQVTYDETRVQAIAPKVGGWVDRLHVDFTGRDVRAGEPLLSIYSPMLVTAQEELLLALRLAGEVSSGTEEARRSSAELVASARRRLAWWDIPASDIDALERSGSVTKTLTLRSPVEGVVIEKSVLAGQRIMEGETLYRIADLDTVWIEGEVFERDLASVRMGARVTVETEVYPGEVRSGTVTWMYPTVDPATRTTRIRVSLANPGHRLRPGMYATIRVQGVRRSGAVNVPRTAVLATGQRVIVFVRRDDGMLEPREVVLGLAVDDRVEVLKGLKVGETVVSSATFLVDAESNLGAAMDAMTTMPGMSTGQGGAATGDTTDHSMHDMSTMPTAKPPDSAAAATSHAHKE